MKVVLAKPSGITLEDHISHVVAEAKELLNAYPFVVEKYAQLSGGKDFSKFLLAAAKYHDDGKKHIKWQTACQLDHQAFLDWKKINPLGTIKDFERAEPEKAGKNLRVSKLRHEIASIVMHKNRDFAMPVKIAIAAHHGKLSIRHEKRWKEDLGQESENMWKEFRKASVENLNISVAAFHEFRKCLKYYPALSGVRAWLVAADQRASGKEAGDIFPDYKPFSYTFPHDLKRSVQQIVEEYWADDFLLVRAPTGAGKTDAALLWAQKQIDNGRATRLVMAMPTRFTSNALSINVSESLSETGLYHSSAWFTKFESKIKNNEIKKEIARGEHEFARKLLTPVTVCTIDHLLMALTLTREDHHQILFNLMNSCLVIDEADFYDEFTQANILVLLEALNEWKIPVMLMSASLPESSRAFYERSGYIIPEIREDKSDLIRPRCRIDSVTEAEEISDLEELLEQILKKESGIIYANTVARAMEYYDWFEKKGVKPVLYHSRFIESDKKKKEENLLKALGKDGRGKGIAILTQIGEMSVNISTDLMLSDLCPIDRLVQRAGRLCRFTTDKVGSLHIIVPHKNGTLYPAPYGIYTRPNWIPYRALLETLERIEKDKEYSAGDFVSFINLVYPSETVFDMASKKNADNLKEYFVSNWMIASQEVSKEDADKAHFWKSRNIEANDDIFVTLPEYSFFNNWSSFQMVKNELAISVHPYLIKIGLEKTMSLGKKKLIVDETEVEIIYVRNPKAYTFEKGLDIGVEYDPFL